MDRRTDYKMALLIEAVIHEAAEQGRSAARELAGLGVPFEVALRVVTRPGERRQQFPPPNHLSGS
jgi:hypothetical protein